MQNKSVLRAVTLLLIVTLVLPLHLAKASELIHNKADGSMARAPSAIQQSGQARILRHSQSNWRWDAAKFASITDVFQAHSDVMDTGIVDQIKAKNPKVLALLYFNTIHIWIITTGAEYNSTRLKMFKDNNWLLKDPSGKYVSTHSGDAYYIDFGHSGYHAWLANFYKGYMNKYGLDGAVLDNWFAEDSVWYTGVSGTPINPRTAEAWTNTDIRDAFKAMTLKIRKVLGLSKIIMVNGIYNGQRFWDFQDLYTDAILRGGIDGLMSEGWISKHDANSSVSQDWWQKSIDFAIWMENNFKGRYFSLIHRDSSFTENNALPSDMTEAQYNEYITYGYASRLLTTKNLHTMMEFGFYIERPYAQSLFEINVGTPTEDYKAEGASVFSRKFTGGMVLVNPTTSSYTVSIPSGYRNAITGADVSTSLAVLPHTGIILKSHSTGDNLDPFQADETTGVDALAAAILISIVAALILATAYIQRRKKHSVYLNTRRTHP